MFLPPRFVAVDDNFDHLQAIMAAFQQLGSPCLGLRYHPDRRLDKSHFRGVRLLFLDLNLITGADLGDQKQNFANIAGILEDNISFAGGPFILFIWTEHDTLVSGLTHYLNEPGALPAHARPLMIKGLSKGQFIYTATGEARAEGVETLRSEVEDAVSSSPQLAALTAWETDVLAAAGGTLSALNELVPDDQQDTDQRAQALGDVLRRLASAAVGQPHVQTDPRAAINQALAPILADRITNQEVAEGTAGIWNNALTSGADRALDPIAAGSINRMLHLAVPRSETIHANDRGAVVAFPECWWDEDLLKEQFGVGIRRLLGGEFKLGNKEREKCGRVLVRVGAACDHAQDLPGSLVYLLGVEIPSDVCRKKDNTGTVRPPASEWSSPWLVTAPGNVPFRLHVNSRYSLHVSRNEAQKWLPMYRLREQLLMQLISHANNYLARPGVLELRPGP